MEDVYSAAVRRQLTALSTMQGVHAFGGGHNTSSGSQIIQQMNSCQNSCSSHRLLNLMHLAHWYGEQSGLLLRIMSMDLFVMVEYCEGQPH